MILVFLTRVGRAIEVALTGQSTFQLTKGEFATSATIDNRVQARMALDEVVGTLDREFGIRLEWPILLELQKPPAISWKATFYNPEGNLGRYTLQELGPRKAHQIQVTPGLTRVRFLAILAHEVVHAYQRESGILRGNQALREGMARWIEYRLLTRSNSPEARKLLHLRMYTNGKSLQTLLDYEARHGTRETMSWLAAQA